MAGPDPRWRPNDREVSAKVIDGEAIILRLTDGVYYSMDKAGAAIWTGVEGRRSASEMAQDIADLFDVAADQARGDVDRLLADLANERLIVEAEAPAGAAAGGLPGADAAARTRAPYAPPVLNIYRDMGDLLALDPPAPGLMDLEWTDSKD